MENATLPGIEPAATPSYQKIGAGDTPRHTQGPWAITQVHGFRSGKAANEFTVVGASGCIAVTPSLSNRDNAANAALISAAPDLLAALRFLVAFADAAPNTCIGHLVEYGEVEIRAAIAKAEGRS